MNIQQLQEQRLQIIIEKKELNDMVYKILCKEDKSRSEGELRIVKIYDDRAKELLVREKFLMEEILRLQRESLHSRKRKLCEDLSEHIKRRKGSISQPLLQTTGSDFVFSDREESFKVFLDCTRRRYNAWKGGLKDKNLHPLPFVADGPGSGKSRYVQELSSSFKDFVARSDESADFKDLLTNALYMNINFGNGHPYTVEDIKIGIEKAVALRILEQVDPDNGRLFVLGYDSTAENEMLLPYTIRKVAGDFKCLVLGIDEINKVHDKNIEAFKELFDLMGGLSSSSPLFFVPIFAGTVVGPVNSVVTKSMHLPCHIPLPLLSLDSCKTILKAKIPDLDIDDPKFNRLLSDIGGHCRALEYLYDALTEYNPSMQDYWVTVASKVRARVYEKYKIDDPALGHALAHAFLSHRVSRNEEVFENIKFVDLEEAGVIKLEPTKELNFRVKIPFVFVWSYLQCTTNPYAKFWYQLLVGKDIGWKEWEEFNNNYTRFSGAVLNIPDDTQIKVPSLDEIKASIISSRPPAFDVGNCVLNGDGAVFDAFTWLYKAKGRSKILLTMQMNLQAQRSPISNVLINTEYEKVNQAIRTHFRRTDFVFLMLCRRDGTIDPNQLPRNTAVVTNSELLSFYGDAYYQRLKK